MAKTLLTEEAAEARRAYHRAWRAAHKEKCREYSKKHMATYWQRKAEKAKAAAAAQASGKDPEELTETDDKPDTLPEIQGGIV